MGHYRSEIGYEDEDARKERERERRLNLLSKGIEQGIHEKGLPRILAELVSDPLMFKIRYER